MTQTVLLGDVAEVLGGGTPSTKNSHFWGGDIPWITPKDLSTHVDMYISKGERNITAPGLEGSSAKLFPAGSVIFSSRAPIGYVTIARIPMTTNQGCKGIICDEVNLHNKFLYYWLKLKKKHIEDLAGGSTFKEISTNGVRNLNIELPDLETQKKVADILRTIDEKIELNRKMNETLEQMGQKLFRHYFIDNPEAEKWEEKNLGDILDLRGGLSYKASFLSDDKADMPMVTMGCVSGKYRINLDAIKRYAGNYKEQHLLNPGDMFIATRDVTQDRILIGSPSIVPETLGQAICATNLYKVVVKVKISTEFLYQLMRTKRYREQIIAHAKGSTIVMLTKDSVLNYKFRVDFSSKSYIEYVNRAETIRRAIDSNSEQIQTLATLRAALLPQLINGRLKV